MYWYVDDSLIIDTPYLVAAIPVDGQGPSDGEHWLMCLLDIGGKARQIHADYASLDARDAAFTALRTHLTAAPVGEGTR